MQDLDTAAKSGNAPSLAAQQNEQNKAKIKASFEDFRVGLDNLEIYFRGTPGLQSYYLKLAGSAEGAATAENLAASGQFDRAHPVAPRAYRRHRPLLPPRGSRCGPGSS